MPRPLVAAGVLAGLIAGCTTVYVAEPPLEQPAQRVPSTSQDDDEIDGKPRTRCAEDGSLQPADGQPIPCAAGCETDEVAGARCRGFDPFGPLDAAVLRRDDRLGPLQLLTEDDGDGDPSNDRWVEINTETGSICSGVRDPSSGRPRCDVAVRTANADPKQAEIREGIEFQVLPDRVVVRARSITLGDRSRLHGTLGVTLIATETIRATDLFTMPCGMGVPPYADNDPARGGDSVRDDAPGGGGNGTRGGHGGANSTVPAASQSIRGGDARTWDENRLVGGGNGGLPGTAAQHQSARNGGSALHLIAGAAFVVEPSTRSDGLPAGVSVRGCGSFQPIYSGGSPSTRIATGGGAGGTLLIEAKRVRLAAATALVANGGSGSSPAYVSGQHGTPSLEPSCPRSTSTGVRSLLGCGGAASSPAGGFCGFDPGFEKPVSGGGGLGVIIIRSESGALEGSSEAMLSPEPMVTAIAAP